MEVINISALGWINVTWDDARGAEAASIAFGHGEVNVRSLRIEAGGEIGQHETGSAQLFVPIRGRLRMAPRRLPRLRVRSVVRGSRRCAIPSPITAQGAAQEALLAAFPQTEVVVAVQAYNGTLERVATLVAALGDAVRS